MTCASTLTHSAVAFLACCFGTATVSAQTNAAPLAPDSARCISAYEGGQSLRAERKLRAARAEFLTCGSETCPVAMQRECLSWLTDVDGEMPSIVIHAHLADGGDVVDVRVLVDGEERQRGLDGGALLLDPGPHKLRFERQGSASQSQDLVVQIGQKLRAIDVVLSASSAPHAASAPPLSRTSESSSSPAKWPGYLLGGLSVLALGSFTYFGVSGVVQYQHLKNDCSPGCDPDDSRDVKQKLRIADVSLAVTALAGVGAAYFLWWRAGSSSGGVEAGALPTQGGFLGAIRGSF